jgi:serine/threonine-protein kinase
VQNNHSGVPPVPFGDVTDAEVLSERYRLAGHLARGGMADVFRGEDMLLGRPVAIKILHPQYASDEKFVARFRREAQAAANLSHPNIVSIFDWGQDNGTYYMVMELIEGRTLRDIRRSEGPLLPRRAAEVAAEAAAALHVAHLAGVYHRDVKPGNIMLTTDGTVKVTDFGIARALDDSEELTRTGAVIGTATYFSPEQAQGVPADERSDVYSLGVVLFELLSGQPPFTGESPVAVAYQHVSEFAPPVSQINPDVPPELEMIVAKAMEKDPAARYQSADEMRQDLLLYLRGELVAEGNGPVAMSPDAATELMTAPGTAATPVRHTGQIEVEERRSNLTYVFSIIGLLGALAVGILLLSNLLSSEDSPAPVSIAIPPLDGLEMNLAFDTLQGLDLKVRQREQISDLVQAGFVIGTDPVAGTTVSAGDFVMVIVSRGPEEFTLPNVVGDTEESARSRITANGFVIGLVTYSFSDTLDEGVVIRQSPASGSADQGTIVDLEVSTGPFALTMPSVVNLAREGALRTLADGGFEDVDVVEEFSAEVLEGFVIRTVPDAQQLVPRGNRVQVFVSKGPEPFPVPDLVGRTPDEARTILAELELVYVEGEETDVTLASGLAGRVSSHTPTVDEEVVIGDEIAVSIGRLIRVPVPDLIAMTFEEAEAELASRGLLIVNGGLVEADPGLGLAGLVAEQTPQPGVLATDGSTVTVMIAMAQIPDLTGLDLATAQIALESMGLTLVDTGDTIIDANNVGVIAQQNPAPGTWVIVGTSVNVWLGEAPPTTTTTTTTPPPTTAAP